MGVDEDVSQAQGEPEISTLTVDARQISREAALRAAYWFTKELHIEFPPSQSEHTFDVVLSRRVSVPTLDNPNPTSLSDLVAEFQDALIDSELRVQVQRETSGGASCKGVCGGWCSRR
jgi:hypothetical protein